MPFTEYRRRETSLPARGGYMYVRRGSHRTHGPRVAARMPARSSASTPIEHSLEHLQTSYTVHSAIALHHTISITPRSNHERRKAERRSRHRPQALTAGAACTRSAEAEPARTTNPSMNWNPIMPRPRSARCRQVSRTGAGRDEATRHDATGAAQSPARPRAQHEHQTSEDRDSVVRTSLLSLRIYGCR